MERIVQSRLFQRFWDFAGAASIRVKVLGIVLGMIVLLGIFVTLQIRFALTRTLELQLQEQGISITGQFVDHAGDLLRADDVEGLEAFLHEWQTHYSSELHNTLIDYIIVTDDSGDLLAHAVAGEEDHDINAYAAALPAFDGGSETRVVEQIEAPSGRVVNVSEPLADNGGVVHLGLGEDNLVRTVNSVTRQIFYITLVMVAIGFAAAFFLTWILTRPILSLVEATQAVARGDFSHRVTRWANDEIGELADAFNTMTQALKKADEERTEREQLRARYTSGVILAQEEERKRIARELHDSTGQSLTSLLVGLRNLEAAVPAGADLGERLHDLREIVGQTLEEVRLLAWQLRPSVLDDLGLEIALKRYIQDFGARYDLHVDYIANGLDERLPVEMETSIYRIVQEALTNIARYAQADNVSVFVDRRDSNVRIIVEDDGVGFDADRVIRDGKSLGLQGIRERARLFDGKLTIESQPGQGTSLFVEMCVPADLLQTASEGETS